MAHYYAEHARQLKRDLAATLAPEVSRRLHERRPLRHFAVAGGVLLALVLAEIGIWHFPQPAIWLPLAAVVGLAVFDCTILLHEVVHDAVFKGARERNKSLRWVYALPSGISGTQFTQWHLDHHEELGFLGDPKRNRLSPKRNERWVKVLYFTPALFFIYFRAAAREVATYPVEQQRQIRRERLASISLHLGLLATAWAVGGPTMALRAYAIPVFFIFPVFFATNRLGQHYDIQSDDVARWSTLMKPSWFWDVAFLNSNYHLEHHYFPGVPLYNLPALSRALQPFFQARDMRTHTYRELLWKYIVLNRPPHADWDTPLPRAEAVVHAG
jgi:fatty acid desaturase